MEKSIMNLKKNDRVQNQFALYYLLDNGKQNMLDEKFVSDLKESINKRNDNNSIITNDLAIGAVDIAVEMAKYSHQDIYNFIYDDVKEQKRQERSR